MTKSIQQIIDEEREKGMLSKVSEHRINSALANQAKSSDPVYKENARIAQQRVLNDPEKVAIRKEAQKHGGLTKKSDPEYQKLMIAVNRKKAENPMFANNVSNGIKQKHQDPEYKEKMRLKANSQCFKIKDPNGKIWDSADEAGQVWFPNPDRPIGPSRKVRNLCKQSGSGWTKT
jgi:hypothetical protein